MIRLPRNEQVLILQAADMNPGPLAEWLKDWIKIARAHSGHVDISEISLPTPEIVPDPSEFTQARENRIAHPSYQVHGTVTGSTGRRVSTKDEREDLRDRRKRLLASVDVMSLPAHQRKAVKKHIDAKITLVTETDRYADSEECWIGDHPMKGWEADDFYLWRIEGTWESGKDLGKWGCEECARLVFKTHPEARIYDL